MTEGDAEDVAVATRAIAFGELWELIGGSSVEAAGVTAV